MIKTLTFLLVLSFSSHTFSGEWKSISIPEAYCGDGLPYRIFLKPGSVQKVAFELMGGGACWGLQSCWSPNMRAWIHPIPKLPTYSYLTSQESPLNDYTFVYFPYCNGDVWMGNHSASYYGVTTYHQGSSNFHKAIRYLKENKLVHFSSVKSFAMYGSSAGALGSLIHIENVSQMLPPRSKKLLILDSPGLHWGKDFWHKFPQLMINDFASHFEKIDLNIDLIDGFIAPEMNDYCKRFSYWRMGFIQSTRDIIMSKMFGEISSERHAKLVMSPLGLRNILNGSKNCKSQIIDGMGHAYLLLKATVDGTKDIDSGLTTKDFVDSLIRESL